MNHVESQANVVRQVLQSVTPVGVENNGISVLDGILPKESKLGKSEESNVSIQGHCKMGNGMLANLLDKKSGEAEPPMVNGVSSHEVRSVVDGNGLGLVAQVDAHKMNGGVDVLLKSLKRPATSGLELVAPPAKTALIQTNGMVLNGPMEVSVNGGEGLASLASTTYTPGAVVNKQSVILNRAQKLVSLPSVGSSAVATAVNNDSNQIQTPPSSKTLIILQPQNKNAVVSSGATNGPLSISSAPVVNGQSYQNGSTSISSSVVNPARSAPLPTDPQIIQLPQTPASPSVIVGGGSVGTTTNNTPGVNSVSSSSTPPILAPLTSSSSSPSSTTSSLSSLSSVPNPVSSNSLSNTNAASTNSSTTTTPSSSLSTTSTVTSVPKVNPQSPFLCEWQGCLTAFKTAKEVEIHAIKVHCPENDGDMSCMWARCDGMKRKRFSLMTHIQDRHCHPQVMRNWNSPGKTSEQRLILMLSFL